MLWASLRQKRITRSWPSFPKSSNASLTSGRPFITLLYIQWPRKSTLSPSGALAHKYDRRNPKQTGISMVTRNYQGWPTTNYLPLSFHLEVSMRHEQIGQGFRNRTVGFVKKKKKKYRDERRRDPICSKFAESRVVLIYFLTASQDHPFYESHVWECRGGISIKSSYRNDIWILLLLYHAWKDFCRMDVSNIRPSYLSNNYHLFTYLNSCYIIFDIICIFSIFLYNWSITKIKPPFTIL